MRNMIDGGESWPFREEAPPRVELVEYERSYTVKADIHAAGQDGVMMNVEAGVLTISSAAPCLADGARVLPRAHAFHYTMMLPDDADETSMSIGCEGRLLILNFVRKFG